MNKILYTSPEIDRCSEIRKNTFLLNEIIFKKNTKFIPVWNSKNFFVKLKDNVNALFLEKKELENIQYFLSIEQLIFLGKANDVYYFSINLGNLIDEIPLTFNGKTVICEELRVFGSTLSQIESSLLALSKGMTYWQMNNKFCGKCGSRTKVEEAGFVLKCNNIECNTSHFPRTDPAIITLISYKDKILLARSSRFPEKMYSTLAGFVEPGESLEQAVKREVFEEVGLIVKNILYFDSQPWPFPASLMLGFFAEAKSQKLKIDYNEIEDAHWFNLKNIEELNHQKLLDGFKLPRIDSIARRLVDHWINQKKG